MATQILFDVEKIRKDFPVLDQKIYDDKPLIFFDSAASSQKPQQVIDSIIQTYSKKYANVHRGIHYLSELASEAYENTREKIQHFINAKRSEEIIFSRNASESINLVASSWGMENVNE
ncbi:MAG: aminotransferase class V-fold PLP-dependent enzyme, partial [Candidatus Hodarchaeales archaeon]